MVLRVVGLLAMLTAATSQPENVELTNAEQSSNQISSRTADAGIDGDKSTFSMTTSSSGKHWWRAAMDLATVHEVGLKASTTGGNNSIDVTLQKGGKEVGVCTSHRGEGEWMMLGCDGVVADGVTVSLTADHTKLRVYEVIVLGILIKQVVLKEPKQSSILCKTGCHPAADAIDGNISTWSKTESSSTMHWWEATMDLMAVQTVILTASTKPIKSISVDLYIGTTKVKNCGLHLGTGKPQTFNCGGVAAEKIYLTTNSGQNPGLMEYLLINDVKVYSTNLPVAEVKAQDYIYFDEDTIRPAICRLEQVDNWVGKKIVLDIEDKCTVTIDEHIEGADYTNKNELGDCNDGDSWEKVWDNTNRTISIQSKGSKLSTNWPLKCSVTISDTADGLNPTTDVDWIYSHEPEIELYPLIKEGGINKLHYNPLTCYLYKVPDLISGSLGTNKTTGSYTIERTISPADAEEIVCSFSFDDMSNADNLFTIHRTENIVMFACVDGFVNDEDKKTCKACTKGTYWEDGACERCTGTLYSPNSAATSCLSCTGTVTDDNTACTPPVENKNCPQGEYRDSDGCLKCPAGTHSDEINSDGKVKCETCQTGHVAEESGAWLCRKCPAGTMEDENRTKCKLCPVGQYQGSHGQSSCTKCGAGSVAPIDGSTSCRLCPPGSKASKDGKCALCDTGSYQNETGQSECKPCTGQQYSAHMGAQACSVCPVISYKVDAKNTKCSLVVADAVDCLSTDIDEFEDGIGVLKFDKTAPQTKSHAACPHNNDRSATYFCKAGPSEWETLDISACKSTVSGKVDNFKQEAVTVEVMDELAANTNIIAPSDVEDMAKTLKDKVSNSVKNAANSTEKESLARSSLALISNISMSSSVSRSSDDSRRNMVTATENIVVALLDSESSKDVVILGESFDVKIIRNNAGDSIKASDTVKLSGLNSVGITMYKNNTLFKEPANETSNGGVVKSTKILGNVIGLKSKQSDQVFKLSVKSDLTEDDANTEKYVEVSCKWYVEAELVWSTEGCNTTSTEEESGVRETTCQCDHMTSFAIIMSVEDVDASQDAFSNVMLVINIIFCVLTLLCIAPFKVFRMKKLMFIQMQILLCLTALSTALLVLGNKHLPHPNSNESCKALAFIIHYLLISLFSWSVCAAFTLKDQIVDALKSYGRKDDWYLTRCMIFSWGLPLLMPAVTMLIANTGQNSDGYIRENHCWYNEKWLYGTVLLPIYLCFIIIIVWYIMVLRVIVNASRNGSCQGSDKKTLKAAFAIACTVGLPWVIHPFVPHKAVATVMQWFFMISVGLQGLGIFICAVLLQDEVLSKVCHTLRITPPSCLMKKQKYNKKKGPKNPTKTTDSMVLSRQGNTSDRIYSSELVTVGQSMTTDHTYNDLDGSSSAVIEEKLMPCPSAPLTNDQVFITHRTPNIRFVGGVRVVSFNDMNNEESLYAGLEEPHYEEFQPPFL